MARLYRWDCLLSSSVYYRNVCRTVCSVGLTVMNCLGHACLEMFLFICQFLEMILLYQKESSVEKGPCCQASWPEFHLHDPYGRKRELFIQVVLWHLHMCYDIHKQCTCKHTHTHVHIINKWIYVISKNNMLSVTILVNCYLLLSLQMFYFTVFCFLGLLTEDLMICFCLCMYVDFFSPIQLSISFVCFAILTTWLWCDIKRSKSSHIFSGLLCFDDFFVSL